MPASEAGGITDVPSIDLPAWIRAVVQLDPDAPELQFEGSWRPWLALASGITGVEGALTSAGFGEGARVGVVVRNRPEVVRAIAGVLGTGRCLVTLSSVVPAPALAADVVGLALPVVIAGAADWTDELRAAARQTGSLGLALGDDEAGPSAVVDAGTRDQGAETLRPGVAVQMLTSGTTGPPKRIDLPYHGIEHEIVSTSRYSSSASLAAPRLASGVTILWAPLLHIGGLRGLISGVVAGRRLAMLERFSVPAWVALVREHRPRVVSLVPSALRMVLDAGVPTEVFDSVEAVVSGTAPLPPETMAQFVDTYGIPVLVVYGATEFAGGVAGWTIRDWRRFGSEKLGSVGRANEGVDARVVDQDSGDPVGHDRVGLLEVRGPQLGQDGWVRTTDLARMDPDGFIWIEGRADDVIIRGGFKVPAGVVAETLSRHPAVLDACVIGLPDRRLGQVPVAAVELRPGTDADPDELRSWAQEHLGGYQVPVEIKIVDALPRTPSMKVSQPLVRALFATS